MAEQNYKSMAGDYFNQHINPVTGQPMTAEEEYELKSGKPAFVPMPPPQMQSVPDGTFTQYPEPPPEGVPPQAPAAQQQPGVFMVQMPRAPRDASTMPVVQSGDMGAGAGQEAIQQIGDMGHVEGTTKTTQYTSPTISKKDGVRLQGEQNKYIQYLKDKRAEKDKAYGEMQEYMLSRNKGKLQGLEMEKAYVNDRIASLEKELNVGVVDPLAKMPTTQRVISILGVVLGTVGHSLSGSKGPNAAIQMFNKAMDRDILMQREKLKKSFEMLKLSTSAKKEIINQMQRREDQMRADGFKAAEYKILRATVDDPTRKAWESGLSLSKELAEKTRGKTTVTTVKKKTPIATLPVAKELMKGKEQEYVKFEKDEKKVLRDSFAAVDGLSIFHNLIKEHKGKAVDSSWIDYVKTKMPGIKDFSNAGRVQGFGRALALGLAAAANMGKPTDADREAIDVMMANVGNSLEMVTKKMVTVKKYVLRKAKGTLEIAELEGNKNKIAAIKSVIKRLEGVRFE